MITGKREESCLEIGGHFERHLSEEAGGGDDVAAVERLALRHLRQVVGDGDDGVAFADARLEARQPHRLALAEVGSRRPPRGATRRVS